jgi:N-acetylglutamate synthase-like GNAT family acetyltransferase
MVQSKKIPRFGFARMFSKKAFKPKGQKKVELRTLRASRPEKPFERFYFVETFKGSERVAHIDVVSTAEKQVKEIEAFFVEPKLREKGIGKKLMEKTLHDLRKQGVKKLIAAALPEAMDFYKGFGFKQVGERLNPSMTLSPLMELDLADYFRKFRKA